ncbi:MAG: phage holin family protein [Bacteroidia bacterium]
MSEVKDHFDILITNVKDYVNTNVRLVKLKVADKSSNAIGGITAIVVIAFIMLLFLVFLSTALAILISNLLNSPSSGYFIIAGVYLLIGVLLFINREKWIIIPLGNSMIKSMLKEEENNNGNLNENGDGTHRNY